jgi:hypothetical protein
MLCEADHHAQRPTHPLHPYFSRRCAQRGYKLAVIAVAHRLCRILFALLRDGGAFDVTQLAVQQGPFRHTSMHPDPRPAQGRGAPPRLSEGGSRRGARRLGMPNDHAQS